jgi:hypothetical protein
MDLLTCSTHTSKMQSDRIHIPTCQTSNPSGQKSTIVFGIWWDQIWNVSYDLKISGEEYTAKCSRAISRITVNFMSDVSETVSVPTSREYFTV